MEYGITAGKITVAALIAFVLAEAQYYAPALILLAVCVAVDYITGLAKGFLSGQLSSETGIKGLVKKFCYFLGVLAGFLADLTICLAIDNLGVDLQIPAVLGLTVTLLLATNELLSILENLTVIGVPMPGAVKKALEIIKGIDKKE